MNMNPTVSRRSAIAASAIGLTALLAGCKTTSQNKTGGKLNIVASFYPMYDFAKRIAGDYADVTCLVPAGTEPHDWEPSSKDMKTIQEADFLIYNGAGMEHWVKDVLDGLGSDTKLVSVETSKGVNLLSLEEDDDHDHDHAKEVKTFEDSEVKDRSLSDWSGEWQSAYPLAKDGSLDKAFKEKAEDGKMSAEEYKAYYIKGFETDISKITIKDNSITYVYDSGKTVSAEYKYVGFFIQNWSTGTKGAMYRFEAVDHNAGAPIYVEFNDHMIESAHAEHFHIRMSNESFDAIVDPENRWPTFYPANLTPEQVSEELASHGKSGHSHNHDHDHGGTDPHVWLSPLNAKIQMKNICDALSEKDSEHKTEYAANLDKANADFDTLDSEFHKGLDPLPNKTIVVSHQAFGYLCEAYGLTQMPIEGVEADAEPNAQEMKEITEFVKEHNVKVIFTEELVSPKVAQAIAEATGARVEELNPLEGLTDEELKAGEDYLSVMRDNLKALEGALV